MRKLLIGLSVAQVVLLVGVLAGYLLAIAATLRRVSQALARVTFGVRAIERQTEPMAAAVREATADLAAVAEHLEDSTQTSSAGG